MPKYDFIFRERKFTNANLLPQIFISFFFKQPKPRKAVTVSTGTKRKRGHARTVPATTLHVELEHVIEDGETLNEEEDCAVIEEAEVTISAVTVEDDGRDAHDEAVAGTMRGQAIHMMTARGITVEYAARKLALQLFPRVSPCCVLRRMY